MHPLDFVESFLRQELSVREVQLSVYRYHPQSLEDDRTVYHVELDVLRSTYEKLKARLDENEDISFDSVVTLRSKAGTKRHLGLVDFETQDVKHAEDASEVLVAEYRPRQAALIHSGNSFHLYLGKLLSHRDWVRFMGRLLLLNARSEAPTIDQRWIGHRLMAGYGALRWSAKGRPKNPEIVRSWS